jgi:hypothetical protein
MGALFVYSGLLMFAAGILLLALPIAAAGMLLGLAALSAPAFDSRAVTPASRLDQITPVWQFHEIHAIHVAAPPERVFAVLRLVRANEISGFTTLTWIRRFGRPLPPGILNAANEPLIDVAIKGGFIALADDAPRELVVGTVVGAPRGAHGPLTAGLFTAPPPGFAVATMNFLVRPDGGRGSWLSTETRVFATSPGARRRFAAYWRVIYPGSAFIRRMWLKAVERRALAAP